MDLPFDAEQVLDGLLVLVVVGTVLAIGTVHPIPMVVTAGLCTLGFALMLWLRRHELPLVPLLLPAAVLGALALYTALQLIPLPLGVLETIAPANADVWARVTLPLAEPPLASAPITVDPGATWVEVLRWLAYAAAFCMAVQVATRRGARFGVGTVFAASVIAALATIGHGLLGQTKVFGLYEPLFRPNAWHVGPLLNPNNLSSYLNLGALCGIGLLLTDRAEVPRWLVAVGVAILVGVNVTTASRGGLAVLVLAGIALAIVVELTRLRRATSAREVRRMRWFMGGTFAFGIALAALGGTKQVWNELYSKNLEKLEMLRWIRHMVAEFAWVGTGRGAFESASPAFQPGHGSTVFTHAENFLAQWAVEWGIVVSAAALTALFWLFRPGRMGVTRSMLTAGAWLGVVAVLAHNLFDLGLEIPGIAIGTVMVLGSLWGDRKRASGGKKRTIRVGLRAAIAIGAAFTVLVVTGAIGVLRVGLHDVATDRLRLQEALLAGPAPRSDNQLASLRSQLRAAMLRHPADPYFPRIGAMLAWQERDQEPMPWIQRALERSLVNGKTHLLLAQVLQASAAKRQALLELRLAVESDPSLTGPAAQLAVRWATTLNGLLATVPEGEARATSLDALGAVAPNRRLAAECDHLALKIDPQRVEPHRRLAEDLLKALGTESGCPDPARCEAELTEHIEALEQIMPRSSTAARLRARQMLVQGDADGAERFLAEACDRFDDRDTCLRSRVKLAAAIPDPERLTKAAKQLLTAVCIERERCAQTASWVGDLHAGRGEWGAAVGHYHQAVRDGENADRLVKLGKAASNANMHAQAARAFERALAHRGGKDAEIERLLREERQRATGPVLGP